MSDPAGNTPRLPPNRKPVMPNLSRRQTLALLASSLAGIFAAVRAQADGALFALPPQSSASAVHQTGIEPGLYRGEWPDGRILTETLRVIGPDMITLQRQGYSTPPLPFRRTSLAQFRNANGSTLTVETPTRLRWTNSGGGNVVIYTRQP